MNEGCCVMNLRIMLLTLQLKKKRRGVLVLLIFSIGVLFPISLIPALILPFATMLGIKCSPFW